jgi:HEPN domain-containing protein
MKLNKLRNNNAIQKERKKLKKYVNKTAILSKEISTISYYFLQIAKIDLEACRILYGKKIYSASSYHLQQAAEKTIKAHALLTGEFTIKEIREISHKTPRFFPILLKKLGEYQNYYEYKHPGIIETASQTKDLIEFKDTNIKFAKISYEMIKELLEKNNQQKKDILRKETKSKSGKEKMLLIELINYHSNIALLYLICFFTFPHESYSRYPDGELKPLEYTNDLGIVKATPELIKLLDEVIQKIDNVIFKKNIMKKIRKIDAEWTL